MFNWTEVVRLSAAEGLQLEPGESFSIRKYQNLQREGSIWLMRRTLSSYIWQEEEGISRDAKLAWCRRTGHLLGR